MHRDRAREEVVHVQPLARSVQVQAVWRAAGVDLAAHGTGVGIDDGDVVALHLRDEQVVARRGEEGGARRRPVVKVDLLGQQVRGLRQVHLREDGTHRLVVQQVATIAEAPAHDVVLLARQHRARAIGRDHHLAQVVGHAAGAVLGVHRARVHRQGDGGQ